LRVAAGFLFFVAYANVAMHSAQTPRDPLALCGRRGRNASAISETSPVTRGGEIAADGSQTAQFTPPNLCFQSLITPGGNSRFPTPVRRQASGHISSKEWSSPNSSLWETWSASERGHRSAAIFKSSMSAAISCSLVFIDIPLRKGVKATCSQRMSLCWASQKNKFGAAAVMGYFGLLANLLMIHNQVGSFGGHHEILGR
jgi:hypothetical protein